MSSSADNPSVNGEVPPSLVFGKNASNKKTFPTTRPNASENGYANFEDGIPSDYSTDAANPLKARIDDVNALGRLASGFHHYRQCGGIVTYNREVSALIGGYPKGAVLEYWDGNLYRRVMSLMDDNVYDFVENPGYIDGIHWVYADTWEKPYCIFVDPSRVEIVQVLPAASGGPNFGWQNDDSVYNAFPWGGSVAPPKLNNIKKSRWIRIEHDSFVALTAYPTDAIGASQYCYMHAGYRLKDSSGIVRTFPMVSDMSGNDAVGSVFPIYGNLKPSTVTTQEICVGSTCFYMRSGSFVQFVYDSTTNVGDRMSISMTIARLKGR